MSPLDIEKIDGVPIAHVHGDIDAATQQQLAYTLGPDASSLIIDLSDTRYLDSAGIDMLLCPQRLPRPPPRQARASGPRHLTAKAPRCDRRPARPQPEATRR